MPVVATVKRGRELARRRHVCIAVQNVADFVRVFFCAASKSEGAATIVDGIASSRKRSIDIGKTRSSLTARFSSAVLGSAGAPPALFGASPKR